MHNSRITAIFISFTNSILMEISVFLSRSKLALMFFFIISFILSAFEFIVIIYFLFLISISISVITCIVVTKLYLVHREMKGTNLFEKIKKMNIYRISSITFHPFIFPPSTEHVSQRFCVCSCPAKS